MADDSIKTISLPLPFPPYSVNAYIVDTGRSKLLFDTGPKVEESINMLKNEIETLGGIDAIILSHGHLDHAGAAKHLSEIYDVPVFASFYEKERLSESFEKRLERRLTKTLKVLDFFSFSKERAKREREKAGYYRDMTEPLEVLFNFSTFTDPEITFLELPGHTRGSIGIYVKSANAVLTGDAFLKDGISSFFDPENPENSLEIYFTSLEKILALSPDKIYPGHGKPFENPKVVAEGHKKEAQATKELILNGIRENQNFKDIIERVFPPNYNSLIAAALLVYALESANIEILQSLKDLLSE